MADNIMAPRTSIFEAKVHSETQNARTIPAAPDIFNQK